MKYFYLDIILSFILAALFTDPAIIVSYFGLRLLGVFYLKYFIQGADFKVKKIYNIVFIMYMSYLALTHFVNIDDPLTDYFYHNDQIVFYKEALRNGLLDWSELIDRSTLSEYPIFVLFTGSLYKLGSFLQVTDLLLFFKMSVVLLGSLIPSTISSTLNLLYIRFKVSSFIYFSVFSYILIQSVVFSRDTPVAFFYTLFAYLIFAPAIKWRTVRILIVMLVIAGLRIQYGLFSLLFFIIFLKSRNGTYKRFIYFIIFILSIAAYYFKVFEFGINMFVEGLEHYGEYIASVSTNPGSLYMKIAGLPFPFNFLFSLFYTVMMPLPIFQWAIDDLTLLPSIISPFYWIYVLSVSACILFKNRREYTALDLFLIASLLCIGLSSYIEPNVRRNFAVYPLIYLHYMVVKNTLSTRYRNSILVFTSLFVVGINIMAYVYLIF